MAQEYQLHFSRADGEIGLTLFIAAEDDGAATVSAVSELHEHASFASVEICAGERLVARIAGQTPETGAA